MVVVGMGPRVRILECNRCNTVVVMHIGLVSELFFVDGLSIWHSGPFHGD